MASVQNIVLCGVYERVLLHTLLAIWLKVEEAAFQHDMFLFCNTQNTFW